MIPELFGQATYRGTRALVFSYVGDANMASLQGTLLDSDSGAELTHAEFEAMAMHALGTLFASEQDIARPPQTRQLPSRGWLSRGPEENHGPPTWSR